MTEQSDFDKPTAWHDDKPTVQVPVSTKYPGVLSIDGDPVRFHELPYEARRVYEKYAKQGGNVRIYQCETCGYLTDADALKASSYDTYQCSNCGRSTGSRGLQRKPTGSFRQVHGPHVRPGEMNEEGWADVLAFAPESQCENDHGPSVEGDVKSVRTRKDVNETAVECGRCVPNHPSHLGRLQNQVEGEVTMREMLHRVAEAVADDRE